MDGTLTNLSTIAANIFVIAGVIIAIFQLFMVKQNFEAANRRKKKEATIEYSDIKLDEAKKLNGEIREALGREKILWDNSQYVNNENDIQAKIKRYLNIMERLSVGLINDVYDIEIFTKMSGGWVINSYDRLIDIINDRRERNDIDRLYIEFEKAANQIRALRTKL